ncbi:MAG TPA: hypothetical protein PK286_07685 [Devosia sp.]|nr:hypothetical protein [Devosia sp.]
MKRLIAIVVAAVLMVVPVGFGSSGVVFAQEEGDCMGAREAQQAVESGQIMELPDAARRAGLERKFIGQQARLCNVDGSPHWVVSVMNNSGESERIVLNAQGN